jgi:pimeloyl-ACP methyl ester carboxylesterase
MNMQRRDFVLLAGNTWIGFQAIGAAGTAEAAAPSRVSAAEFTAARRVVDTRFGRIAHVDQGRGEAVLFLHGYPLNSFQWRDAIKQLSTRRRCLAPDFLGLGYTEVAPGQGCGPLDQCAMLIEFLDAKGVQQVDVIASDSGGAVAQHLVTKHPGRVRTLLLANCDAEPDYPLAALQPVFGLAKQGRFADDVIGKWKADKTAARAADGLGGPCYADAGQPTDEAIDYYFAPLIASPEKKAALHAYTLALEANPLAGIEAALKQCRVPVRIVWGAADRVFSEQSPGYLARTFGNVQGLRMLEGRKLFWPEELPEVVVEEAGRSWG